MQFCLFLTTVIILCDAMIKKSDDHERLERIDKINKVRQHLLLEEMVSAKLAADAKNDNDTNWFRV